MKVKLVKIGNSLGIRLPKTVIQECGFESEVMLDVRHKSVILTASTSVRQGWEKQFEEDLLSKPVTQKGEWQW